VGWRKMQAQSISKRPCRQSRANMDFYRNLLLRLWKRTKMTICTGKIYKTVLDHLSAAMLLGSTVMAISSSSL
jgi:hypothetical protein